LLARLIIAVIALSLLAHAPVMGQSVLFSRLNTSNGLSDNNARCIAIDNNGFVWIGTNAGLNVYDGYGVKTYTREKHPQLASNEIMHLVSDSQNRIWMDTSTGATWMDANRSFHRVVIKDSITKFFCPTIVETESYGIVLHTDKGEYYYDSAVKKWKELEWIPPVIRKGAFVDAEPFAADKIIFTIDTIVALLDYKTRRITYQHSFEVPLSACPVSDSSIAVGMYKGEVAVINIFSGRTIASYQLTNTLNNKTISTHLTEVRRAANGELLVATDFAGLIIIDTEGNVSKYTHDPLVPTTVSANNTFRSFAGKRGEIVVGTFTSGANMANIFNRPAGYARIFSDGKGNMYDNYVTSIVEEGNGWFWVAGYDRLVRWNRQTGQSEFYYYYVQDAGGTRALELWAMCKDRTGRLWVSAGGDGLAYFNKATGSFTKVKRDTSLGIAVSSPHINALLLLSDGNILVGSGYGIYSFDPRTLKVTSYADHPVLKAINNNRILSLFEDKYQRIWIATLTRGAFCYDKRHNTLRNYTKAEGLSSNLVLGFGEDDFDNAYIATWQGFSMVSKDGQVKTYDRKNGLRYERCEGFLKDDSGYVWVANNKCLIKVNPSTGKFTYYEDNSGLSIDGFRPNTFIRASTRELFWGTEKGVNHFFPASLSTTPSQLQVSLYAVDVEDSLHYFGCDAHFAFPYSKNDITFHFAAIDLNGSRDILYEYRLEGYDKEWHSGTDIREARYPSLPSGDYTFRVRASLDGINWKPSNNIVFMNIVPPVWQRWWFIALMVMLLALIIHTAYWLRLRQIREREKMKAEYNQKIAEIEMKALRAQMNPHFIFNCLNSINRYIVKSDHTTASLYLTRFSKLIRLILDNSNSKNVLLSNELEALKIYIEMEALRFNDKFSYDITLEKNVCPDAVEVPPLIIQPYVENAIWHGLLHKESSGHLSIRINLLGDNVLECVIEDDGVGREKAMEYKSKSATTKKSLGMKLTEDRISILNKHASLSASVTIVDLVSADGEPAGTRVVLKIPV
jgi:hypothetical protein